MALSVWQHGKGNLGCIRERCFGAVLRNQTAQVIRFVQNTKSAKRKHMLLDTAHFIFVHLKVADTTFSHRNLKDQT